MAWLSGYTYRKSFTVSRASGAVTDYQIKLLIGESSGASGEQVDCGGLCTSDFRDIRFTTSDEETQLNYWIESITGTTPNQLATVWVKFDSICTSATTFYMYYGNSVATSASNGFNTFIVFDDFERGANGDSVGWASSVNFTISTDHAYSGTRCAKLQGNASSWQSYAYIPVTASNDIAIQFRFWKEGGAYFSSYHGNNTKFIVTDCVTNELIYTGYTSTGKYCLQDQWDWMELRGFDWSTYAAALYYTNNQLAKSPVTFVNGTNGYNELKFADQGGGVGNDTYIDNVIVRKFYATEPTVGTWGAVEQLDTYSLITSGGVVVGGEFGLPYYLTTSGGLVAGGSSLYATGYKIDATAGLIAGGNIGLAYGYKAITSGGFLAGGTFTLPSGVIMSGGAVVGGTSPLHTESGITTSGGFLAGANMVKKQIPYELDTPAALAFGLTDASINFKLEQQP